MRCMRAQRCMTLAMDECTMGRPSAVVAQPQWGMLGDNMMWACEQYHWINVREQRRPVDREHVHLPLGSCMRKRASASAGGAAGSLQGGPARLRQICQRGLQGGQERSPVIEVLNAGCAHGAGTLQRLAQQSHLHTWWMLGGT